MSAALQIICAAKSVLYKDFGRTFHTTPTSTWFVPVPAEKAALG